MKNFNEIFDGYRYKLKDISYNTFDMEDDENSEVEISFVDDFDIVKNNDKILIIDFNRKLIMSGDALFNLSITYRIEHFVKQDENIHLKDYNIDEEIKKNIEMFSGNVMSKVSLLISEITSNFGTFPIITPPIVKIED
ncbi:MAG: hypothetical protein ACI31S_04100 [Bacilli bacterium]